ncbi:MAG: TetR/AcrR family transcriptional regulator [Eubacteriales bacterium]
MNKKTYKISEITKNNIINAATLLFYEKGYKNTYFDEIAASCGITKPLISYYFKRKSTLAKVVHEKVTNENKNFIALRLYKTYYGLKKYDLKLSTAVEIQMTNRLYHEDKKAFRFYKERSDSYYSDMCSHKLVNLYQIHDRHYNLDINRNTDEISMLAYAAHGATLSLKLAFYRGELNCSFEEYNDYATALHFKLMHIDENEINYLLEVSKKMIKQSNFKVLPYFRIG